jgi:hypothetical protein
VAFIKGTRNTFHEPRRRPCCLCLTEVAEQFRQDIGLFAVEDLVMASSKKRRKAANQARKAKAGPRRGVHPDGDRRRRAQMTAAVAAAAQWRAMEQNLGVILPDGATQANDQG